MVVIVCSEKLFISIWERKILKLWFVCMCAGMEDMSAGGPPMGGSGDQYFNATFNPAPGSNMNDFSPFVSWFSLVFLILFLGPSTIHSTHPIVFFFVSVTLSVSVCVSVLVFVSFLFPFHLCLDNFID